VAGISLSTALTIGLLPSAKLYSDLLSSHSLDCLFEILDSISVFSSSKSSPLSALKIYINWCENVRVFLQEKDY